MEREQFLLYISHPRMSGYVELRAQSAYGARVEVLAAFGRSRALTLTLYARRSDGSLRSLGVVSERASVTVNSTAREVVS